MGRKGSKARKKKARVQSTPGRVMGTLPLSPEVGRSDQRAKLAGRQPSAGVVGGGVEA